VPLDTPLPKAHLRLFKRLPLGATSQTISLPIKRTRGHDGPRAVSMRLRVYGAPGAQTRTVTVVDPRR
jgi:hypothetical protein